MDRRHGRRWHHLAAGPLAAIAVVVLSIGAGGSAPTPPVADAAVGGSDGVVPPRVAPRATAPVPAPPPAPVASPVTDSPAAASPGLPSDVAAAPVDFALAPLPVPVRPTRLSIPSIGLSVPITDDLGLAADRSIEVPADPHAVGWYRHRPVPGQAGPAILLGHVDSHTGPAVFFALSQVEVGDRVTVVRSDRRRLVFRVQAVERHAKHRFPTDRVYGPTDRAALRLITCGGSFDAAAGGYEENVIVFAVLESWSLVTAGFGQIADREP